ncbi:uncharacterized protein PGTG_21480 [Puccinia graminis f. sp. tritici CRL 75-36-700-3]|uniref:Uncharacterized protein n=1 Tax=Puccinia graminis f. sp. tritici (strain CRL 75-36-700-3 / race SCCL) TaxID=418459 RepID=H6QRT3_PUCGT|nr:uncharacterized protein PGTG_21480 [Puccinia graminis f. sp. tritici CRL 75-36-700-3]EHS63406.1 hypothetical protein PGTG_21480 [Puccinia graminis f. sp. tritici CRL 75-36-700-3]
MEPSLGASEDRESGDRRPGTRETRRRNTGDRKDRGQPTGTSFFLPSLAM